MAVMPRQLMAFTNLAPAVGVGAITANRPQAAISECGG